MLRWQKVKWEQITTAMLDTEPKEIRFDYDTDADAILCKTYDDASCIADFFVAFGFDVIHIEDMEEADMFGFRFLVYPD